MRGVRWESVFSHTVLHCHYKQHTISETDIPSTTHLSPPELFDAAMRGAEHQQASTVCLIPLPRAGRAVETNRSQIGAGLRVGKEVRNICLFASSSKRKVARGESGLSSPTAHDLIAILQHKPCEEIGQATGFLSCRSGSQLRSGDGTFE